MPETVRFSLIGKQDIRFGKGTFEITLADGSVVILEEVNIGRIIADTLLSDPIVMTAIDDFSATVAQMQTATDPGAVGTESLPTDLEGEVRRLRFVIKRLMWAVDPGEAVVDQWYEDPVANMEQMFFGIFQ